jgi:hypothetical protein
MLKSLLASIGFGQSDLISAFKQTLERLDRREVVTHDRRVGQAQAVDEMLGVLRDEDVMSSDTLHHLKGTLDEWVRRGPSKPQAPPA